MLDKLNWMFYSHSHLFIVSLSIYKIRLLTGMQTHVHFQCATWWSRITTEVTQMWPQFTMNIIFVNPQHSRIGESTTTNITFSKWTGFLFLLCHMNYLSQTWPQNPLYITFVCFLVFLKYGSLTAYGISRQNVKQKKNNVQWISNDSKGTVSGLF